MKKLNIKIKNIHILIIILGIIFISLAAFHTNLWFDESYSVAISNNHTFGEIWSIGGYDVHPILYYWILKIVSLIFGNNILAFRLISVIALSILGILGYTHIRKDFGEKVGLLFSFLVYFLPVNVIYASEIRMYTVGMLFVTIMAIYAYRIFKGNKSIKNWIIFAIFSLASAYTHYYGLMSAGIINILLFILLLKNAIKERKFTKDLTTFLVQGIIQIILYIPWIMALLTQMSQVSAGFWVQWEFPKTFIDMFAFQFTGNLDDSIYINNWVAIIYGLIITVYVIYLIIKNIKSKNKQDIKPARYAIIIYFAVILGAIVVSIVLKRSIIYARYLLLITGLFIFFLAFIMEKLGNRKVNLVIYILTVIIATIVNINMIQTNYDSSNSEPINYIKENIQEGDILVYGNEGSGFIISANLPEYTQYFYDKEHWNVEEAYKAYGPNMTTVYDLSFLDDYTGRIWLINAGNNVLLEQVEEKYGEAVQLVSQQNFSVKYKKYQYTFNLVEKNVTIHSHI